MMDPNVLVQINDVFVFLVIFFPAMKIRLASPDLVSPITAQTHS